MSVGYNIVRSVGPAFGGVILAFFGPLAAFALAAVSDLAPLAVYRHSDLGNRRLVMGLLPGRRLLVGTNQCAVEHHLVILRIPIRSANIRSHTGLTAPEVCRLSRRWHCSLLSSYRRAIPRSRSNLNADLNRECRLAR
nr:MFS transporter [Mesorhizobium sp. AR02]